MRFRVITKYRYFDTKDQIIPMVFLLGELIPCASTKNSRRQLNRRGFQHQKEQRLISIALGSKSKKQVEQSVPRSSTYITTVGPQCQLFHHLSFEHFFLLPPCFHGYRRSLMRHFCLHTGEFHNRFVKLICMINEFLHIERGTLRLRLRVTRRHRHKVPRSIAYQTYFILMAN